LWIISDVFYAFYGPLVLVSYIIPSAMAWDSVYYIILLLCLYLFIYLFIYFFKGEGGGVGRLLHKVIRNVNAIRTPKFNPIVLFFLQTFGTTSVCISFCISVKM